MEVTARTSILCVVPKCLPGLKMLAQDGLLERKARLDRVDHCCNASTRKAEAGGSEVESHLERYPQLYSKLKASLGYKMGSCIKQTLRVWKREGPDTL